MGKRLTGLVCVIIVAALLLGACAPPAGRKAEPQKTDDIKQVIEAAETVDTSLPGPAPNNDKEIVIAMVDGEPVYKDRYISRLQNLGEGADPNQAIEMVVNEKIILLSMERQGYMELTAEEEAQVQQKVQENIDQYVSVYDSAIKQELGEDYTEAAYKEKAAEYEAQYLVQIGMTREELEDYYRQDIGLERGMDALLGDIEPTEDEVRQSYDMILESDKAAVEEDPAAYESILAQGRTPYYTPEGLFRVRHILIGFDDETTGKIRAYLMEGEEEKANALKDENLPNIIDEANKALQALKNGEMTFDEAIEAYNDDPGMAAYPEGYLVYEGCSLVPEFVKGAQSLEKVGDFTELVPTVYGYHIIQYASDVPAGSTPYEDVRDDIASQMGSMMKQDAWVALVGEWKAGMDIDIYYERL